MIGGAIITASGIVMATGGEDHQLWAYDLDTGNKLWESDLLPYDPVSIPMTYKVGGRQFVTVGMGGHWADGGFFEKGGLLYSFSLSDEMSTTEPTQIPSTGAVFYMHWNVVVLTMISSLITCIF